MQRKTFIAWAAAMIASAVALSQETPPTGPTVPEPATPAEPPPAVAQAAPPQTVAAVEPPPAPTPEPPPAPAPAPGTTPAAPAGAADLEDMLGAKIEALLDGRFNVSFEDLAAIAPAALRHRLLLNFEGQAQGISSDQIVADLLATVPIP